MSKVVLDIDINQAKALIRQMPIEEKIPLIKELEKETWARRLDEVVLRIRKRFKKHPLSFRQITQICEGVRHKRYEKSKSSH